MNDFDKNGGLTLVIIIFLFMVFSLATNKIIGEDTLKIVFASLFSFLAGKYTSKGGV